MALLTTTLKVRIYPDERQAKLLRDMLHAYTAAANYASRYVYRKNDYKQLSIHKAIYRKLRERYGLGSQMACSVPKTVLASYKAMKSNGHEITNPCEYKHAFAALVRKDDWSMAKGQLSIGTLEGRVKVGYAHRHADPILLDSKYRQGTATLLERHGKFYLHIPVTCETDDPASSTNVVGIDLGINFLATAYDSDGKTTFYNGRGIKNRRAQYKKTRTQLQQRRTPSARRRLKSIGRRENRWMSDVNHCVAKALVTRYGADTLFVVEDLSGVRAATERVRRRDRYVSVSWAFYDFQQKLGYKAQKAGSRMMKIDPAYTSQDCPRCGHRDKNNRDKKLHRFECRSCRYRSNDDRVGAMNIQTRGKLAVPELHESTPATPIKGNVRAHPARSGRQ